MTDVVKAVPGLIYGCNEGPNTVEIGGMTGYEVVGLVSVDGGETVFEKTMLFPSYQLADKFMTFVNHANEPLHINFYEDPDFDDDMYQEVEVPGRVDEDSE